MQAEDQSLHTKELSPQERKQRVQRITKNFFLHIHSAKVHLHALQPGYTLGFGLILGFLFLIMVLTGALLLMHYTPSVEHAYNSVKDIVHVVPGGRIVRNIHRLSSTMMVIVVFMHLLRVFYTASYSKGRASNWVIGVVMFVLVLLMSFSGYLLPWDQLSYWAVTIGSNIAASARELTDLLGITSFFDPGGFLQRLLIGDSVVGQPALTRFFMLHIIFLPVTMVILISVHLWRIRKDGGLSRPENLGNVPDEKVYSWPTLMWIELGVLIGLTALLVSLSLFINAPLIEEANPAHPENPAKSPWYFLGIQELVSYSAFAGGMLVPILFLSFLFSIPYVDREEQYIGSWFSGKQGAKITLFSAGFSLIVVLLQLFIMVKFGWVRDWWPGVPQWLVMIFNPAILSAISYIVYAQIIRKRTGSSRMAAIALFSMAIIALILYTIVGIWFRQANWEFGII